MPIPRPGDSVVGMDVLSDVWPLFGLSLRTPRLELRPVRDDDLPGLADAALAGIHDPAVMPFTNPWTDAPKDVLVRGLAQFHWGNRARLGPDDWMLSFTILLDGVCIGMQDLGAKEFANRKTVVTGSWLSMAHQGVGYGKEMRAAVLMFAFDHLRAEVAETAAVSWNTASTGVSRRLGYVENGVERDTSRPGQLDEIQRFRITPELFVRPEWSLAVDGLDGPTRQQLGA
jgi:RimJ/RimL family protein N-acetyltransferase